MMRKSGLGILLSELKGFSNPKPNLEQYSTPSEFAAEILHFSTLNNEIDQKVIVDLGCGTGILGIGALIMGAKKVYFVDIDEKALEMCQKNINYIESELNTKYDYEIINSDVKALDEKIAKLDLALCNPPFGIQEKHADRNFIDEINKLADKAYFFAMEDSDEFIRKNFETLKFNTIKQFRFKFPLKNTMSFHNKPTKYIHVVCWRCIRQ